MSDTRPIRLGIMGFGQTGRQIYQLAAHSQDIEVVAIADIGGPDILHYLLCAEVGETSAFKLEGNFLVNPRFRSRMVAIDMPAEMPWDAFGVDCVIDSTGIFRAGEFMQDHLDNGAPRVLLRGLPADHIDRIVVPGINEHTIVATDRMLSAGSATTTALALLLKILSTEFTIECVSMTSVHAYTSDQALQDYAGSDFRRSRSAAVNIIPNTHEAGAWIGHLLPEFENRVMTAALNVPVHRGCLLDTNLVLEDSTVDAQQVNDVMRAALAAHRGVVDVVEDPIVSSDVLGNSHSLLFDTQGTIKAGNNTIKTLAWYENLGHAARLLDVTRLYAELDRQEEAA
jgi:glyceraldehyde 3-phosphate dehydrogenase